MHSDTNSLKPVIPAKLAPDFDPGGNPGKHRIPDQVRNDKSNKTHAFRYIKAFDSFKDMIVNDVLDVVS